MRAEHDHRQRRAAHNQAQRFHSVHPRHFQVECDDVGMKLLDFLQREGAVHRRTHHFDGWVALENRGDELAHQCGIIDDEDADPLAHAIAPRGVARDSRERTAGTFKIKTTVPSPRIEAPLTRSLEMISLGSALMTSSSSPTRLSTMSPKRFSAAPMTITKLRFFFFSAAASTAWISLSRLRRTNVRICSRKRKTSRRSTRWISLSVIRVISTTEESGTAKSLPATRKSRV